MFKKLPGHPKGSAPAHVASETKQEVQGAQGVRCAFPALLEETSQRKGLPSSMGEAEHTGSNPSRPCVSPCTEPRRKDWGSRRVCSARVLGAQQSGLLPAPHTTPSSSRLFKEPVEEGGRSRTAALQGSERRELLPSFLPPSFLPWELRKKKQEVPSRGELGLLFLLQ